MIIQTHNPLKNKLKSQSRCMQRLLLLGMPQSAYSHMILQVNCYNKRMSIRKSHKSLQFDETAVLYRITWWTQILWYYLVSRFWRNKSFFVSYIFTCVVESRFFRFSQPTWHFKIIILTVNPDSSKLVSQQGFFPINIWWLYE